MNATYDAGSEDVQKFLLTLIDPEAWDRAVWRGCAYFFQEGQPPRLAFMFQHAEAGREIFAGLRALLGPDDEESLLRICIIEGRFVGNSNAYAVNVGANHRNVYRHFGLSKETIAHETFGKWMRFHRMNPRTLDLLRFFKHLFKRFGVYKLIPAVVRGQSAYPIDELGILKRDLIFRKQTDIRPHDDEDALALEEDFSTP
jgi:hypothetical protein